MLLKILYNRLCVLVCTTVCNPCACVLSVVALSGGRLGGTWRQRCYMYNLGVHLCGAQGEKMDEVIVADVVEQLVDHVGVTSM